jgi:large subunit ribosomal protein L6
MSRVGKLPVKLPQGVKVAVAGGRVNVEGPKGKAAQPLPEGIACEVVENEIRVSRADETKSQKALHGLVRSLLSNAVRGVSEGFTRQLQIEGIGYRAQLQGAELNLTLGFSHPVVYKVPEGITVTLEGQTKIAVSGTDRQRVGQVAAEIRGLKPPEPYKGKGIRYADEHVKRKVGKTGA